jgi:hypothetical protein
MALLWAGASQRIGMGLLRSRGREAIGPDVALMCDINQRWRPEQAIGIGKRVEDTGVGSIWCAPVE